VAFACLSGLRTSCQVDLPPSFARQLLGAGPVMSVHHSEAEAAMRHLYAAIDYFCAARLADADQAWPPAPGLGPGELRGGPAATKPWVRDLRQIDEAKGLGERTCRPAARRVVSCRRANYRCRRHPGRPRRFVSRTPAYGLNPPALNPRAAPGGEAVPGAKRIEVPRSAPRAAWCP